MTETLTWTDLDRRAVDIARVLAADAVEKVGNGHPGTAISVAPIAYLLYQKVMRLDPKDPAWIGRDRFVLSIGHSSLTQYVQLYLAGYGLELDDLASFRTWGSRTPGHPEAGHTAGVECTTGPLGAGVANAVGFAMAARRERHLYDPSATDQSIFDHRVYCLAGDGDMQEGVSAEACSLAGTQELGNLILIYDDNHISIEGDTKIAFTEDVDARYRSYGWHVQSVDFTAGGAYEEKVAELHAAVLAAQQVTDRPSYIRVRTVIGWPLPHKAGHHSVHGSKIGAEEVAALKQRLGLDPTRSFDVPADVIAHTRTQAADRARAARADWDARRATWATADPAAAALLERVQSGQTAPGLAQALPQFPPDKKVSTRVASGQVLSAIAEVVPELWGGSADLAGSNNTTMAGQPSFLPADRVTADWPGGPEGRVLHFGIREHAMGAILNAIALSGLTRAYGGTFLVFADYMRNPPRVAALTGVPAIYVWTHDSIGVGEDGPTHQPVEQIASLRLIPGLDVVRPADANEVAACWAEILRVRNRPQALILSRQDLTVFDRSPGSGFAPADQVVRGAYTLIEASQPPRVVVVATGSEVEIAVQARALLEAEGIPTRVVSAPCLEWFAAQPAEYKNQILPTDAAKVSIEAGVTYGWAEIVSSQGRRIGVDHFGASAAAGRLFVEYGITAENVAAEAKIALAELEV
ncbi:MAG: transketolase [Propionibacteriaceae bacterium]|nr:transketolase [Propionibacteriaceae bacterium]